jgi:hypothetical protein
VFSVLLTPTSDLVERIFYFSFSHDLNIEHDWVANHYGAVSISLSASSFHPRC